jgi:hypothetical protein
MSKNLVIFGNGEWEMGNGKEFQGFFIVFDFSQPI